MKCYNHIVINFGVDILKNYKTIESLIGNTPLIKLNNFMEINNINATLLAKLEFFNPAGSVKDRVALKMIKDAEADGKINKNSILIEPTSGNTGIGIAAVGVSKGYRVIITMPSTMSAERIKIMRAYGAEVVLTDGTKGMSGAIEEAERLAKEFPSAFVMGQFTNSSNPSAHYETTGPEIWQDTDGEIDILVSCVGTGGTITGTAKYLKEKNPKIKVVAVEPASSPVLSKGKSGSHKIQGIGAGFIPSILDTTIIDEIITVTDDEAYNFGSQVAKTDGVLVGISSGAALAAAVEISKRTENVGKNIVVILPDTGMRYLSTENYF